MKLTNTRKCAHVVSVCQASTCVLLGQKILEALALCATLGLAPDPDSRPHPSVSTKSLKAREAWLSIASGWLGAHSQSAPLLSAGTPAQPGWVSKLSQPPRHTIREAEGGFWAPSHSGQGLGSSRFL